MYGLQLLYARMSISENQPRENAPLRFQPNERARHIRALGCTDWPDRTRYCQNVQSNGSGHRPTFQEVTCGSRNSCDFGIQVVNREREERLEEDVRDNG